MTDMSFRRRERTNGAIATLMAQSNAGGALWMTAIASQFSSTAG